MKNQGCSEERTAFFMGRYLRRSVEGIGTGKGYSAIIFFSLLGERSESEDCIEECFIINCSNVVTRVDSWEI